MKFCARFVIRYAAWIASLGTVLALVAGYYSVLLYMNLRTDIQELLPTTARSVLDYHEVSARLESIDSLGVLVFSNQTAQSKKFVVDLAERLNQAPKNIISSVEYKIDQELQFFKTRQALFIDIPDLIQIRNYIQHRIAYERELYNPLTIFNNVELVEPHFDFAALQKKYEGSVSQYSRLPGGFYATPDETKRVVLVNIPGTASKISDQNRLKDWVVRTIDELKPTSYAPDLMIQYTGGVEDSIEEQSALVADLELSTVIVSVIVLLGMFIFYRTFRATCALMLSLFMGTFWTFGTAYFAVGYLNANSAFLGSIVIGNGINFGIIYLARYLEERRRGFSSHRATFIAMTQSATSTWVAALAAGLSYGSLMLTGFRGFKQFGVIGLIGMVLCWLSAYTLLPAYLVLLEKLRPLVRPHSRPPRPIVAGGIAWLVGKYPKFICALSLVITLASIYVCIGDHSQILETDLSKLRNKESMTSGSAYLSKYLDEIFQHYLSPLVILPHSKNNSILIAERLKAKKVQEGDQSLIATVQTIADFIPQQQCEKIQILKQIQTLLPPALLKRLSPQDQERVKSFLTTESLMPFTEKDLPSLVRHKFMEKDGSIGKLVLVAPPLTHEVWDGRNLIRFIHDLRSAADSVEKNAPVAGSNAISSDMILAISTDGPQATFFAFLAVVLLVVALFRNVKTIALILFSLLLGVLWLAGLIFAFHFKINFLNFIALPITFGIGVDYGVNIFQRYRENKNQDILHVIKNTGSAVCLCSFSTITGYTSLLIAGNQGFVSFGLIAVAGEVTCLLAAMIALPAFLALQKKQKNHR